MKLLQKDHVGPDVIHAIEHMDADVVDLLGGIATATRPANSYQRENAVYVLGMLGRHDAIVYLERLLGSPDLNLRVLAARALGRIGTPAALAPLRRLYNGTAGCGTLPPALALELRDILGGPHA
jgi:hypothetical protein